MFVPYGTATVNGSAISVYWIVLGGRFVTVDTELPNGGGTYDRPVSNALWVALAEKAYAQANGAGWVTSNNVGSNSYAALNSGKPEWALQAITGYSASRFDIDPDDAASAWNAGALVVLNTNNPSSSFIVGSHSYAMVGYDPSSNEPFELMNGWGDDGNGWAPGQSNTKYGLFSASASFVSDNFDSQSIGTGAAPSGLAVDMQSSQTAAQKENQARTTGSATNPAGTTELALLSAPHKQSDTADNREMQAGGVTNGGHLNHALLLDLVMHRGEGQHRRTAQEGVAGSDLFFSRLTLDFDQPFTLA
jgi:hypothetical protein